MSTAWTLRHSLGLTAGKNSRRIVASMGIFPPNPRPHSAARAQMAPKLLGTPMTDEKRQKLRAVALVLAGDSSPSCRRNRKQVSGRFSNLKETITELTSRPKKLVTKREMLNAHFRPMTSIRTPQTKAPAQRPALKDEERSPLQRKSGSSMSY